MALATGAAPSGVMAGAGVPAGLMGALQGGGGALAMSGIVGALNGVIHTSPALGQNASPLQQHAAAATSVVTSGALPINSRSGPATYN